MRTALALTWVLVHAATAYAGGPRPVAATLTSLVVSLCLVVLAIALGIYGQRRTR